MYRKFLLASFVSLLALPCAHATQNDLPSCYEANKMEVAAPAAKREVLILLDETTVFGEKMQQSILQSTLPLLTHGTSVSIVRFSAFAQQKYTSTVMHGLLEESIPDSARNSISVKKLKTFDACLGGQLNFAVGNARKLMLQTMSTASSDLQKSDVIGSLKSVSDILRSSPTKERVMVVVSDMLENSSISSFYAKSGVRLLDPAVELGKVQKSDMFGAFGGARVYVMGAGTVPEDGKNAKGIYRDPKTMQALQKFWTGYVEKSGGTLEEFGQPELLTPIK